MHFHSATGMLLVLSNDKAMPYSDFIIRWDKNIFISLYLPYIKIFHKRHTQLFFPISLILNVFWKYFKLLVDVHNFYSIFKLRLEASVGWSVCLWKKNLDDPAFILKSINKVPRAFGKRWWWGGEGEWAYYAPTGSFYKELCLWKICLIS